MKFVCEIGCINLSRGEWNNFVSATKVNQFHYGISKVSIQLRLFSTNSYQLIYFNSIALTTVLDRVTAN